MSEANKALVRRFYEAFNERNLGALDSLIAPDFVDHNPLPGQAPGLKGLKDTMEMFRSAFPDMHIKNEDFIAEGDKVVVRSDGRGTNTGAMMGIPPTGKPANFAALDVWAVKNGKLIECWHIEELLQMMMQLGIVPPPAG